MQWTVLGVENTENPRISAEVMVLLLVGDDARAWEAERTKCDKKRYIDQRAS